MVDLKSLTDKVDDIFKSFGIEFKDKLKRDISSLPDEIEEVTGNTQDIIEDPTGKLLNPIKMASNNLLGAFVIGFIYFIIGAIILFSVYQIFRSNPKPLLDIKKGSKKAISKSKKIIKRGKSK